MTADSPLRLAVFDCDGTLVDSQHSIVDAMFQAFDARNHRRPSADAVRHVVGLPLLEAVARLFPEGGTSDHERLEQSYIEAFRGLRAGGEVADALYPGAVEILDTLAAAGWVLGVATGKSSRGLMATLDSHGIRERFATLQTADLGPGKPHPDMLRRAMAEAGVEPEYTAMVGDTSFDMEMARRAGTVAVGVAWGYHPEEQLHTAGAHAVIQEFAELPETLDDLGGVSR